ncbi:MAG: hypothetical protein JW771_07100 [Candidatus Thermoplasmatota archaeon]|nr:hypothetical protein [Candidatus Thermoplasmatota archaeon]
MLSTIIDEGYILSNKFRRVIFDELSSGEKDLQHIIKKHRLIKRVAQHIIDEFISGGIVTKKGSLFYLTEEGEKLATKI